MTKASKNNQKSDLYSVKVYCRNCGEGSMKMTEDGEFFSQDIVVPIPKGTLLKDAKCPNCGNKKLSLQTE